MGEDQPVIEQPEQVGSMKIKVAILKWEREIPNTVRDESKVEEARKWQVLHEAQITL